MNDPRLLRLARQLLDERYIDDEANALEAAADILAVADEHRRAARENDPKDDDDPEDETARLQPGPRPAATHSVRHSG